MFWNVKVFKNIAEKDIRHLKTFYTITDFEWRHFFQNGRQNHIKTPSTSM